MTPTGDDVMKVTIGEFQDNVALYQDKAEREPVAIVNDGETRSVLVSAALFETLLKGRLSRAVEHLDDDALAAIQEARVSEVHAHLDDLIADWTPLCYRDPNRVWSFAMLISGHKRRRRGEMKGKRIDPALLLRDAVSLAVWRS
jgi:PHD/YefM family antitoxin component YafN of YafNO toxin-antitoxin module